MTQQTSRRAFLRGGFRDSGVIRPPGALPVMQFEDACTRCGDCARACPEGIIIIDKEGFPVVSLRQGECTFCNACTDVCETEALDASRPWPWRAEIQSGCLSQNGVECRTCQDHCDSRAIRFRPALGGRAQLEFDRDSCVGCGACIATCPVNAIQLTQISQRTEASPC